MKLKVAIIFGGKSSEHEISLCSATNIYNTIDKDIFDVLLLGIDKKGKWKFNSHYPKECIDLNKENYFQESISVIINNIDDRVSIIDENTFHVLETFDIAFSIIHGTQGEDGTLQGFFTFLNVPFIGPNVLGSAICMDKDIAKRLLRDSGIPVARFITLTTYNKNINFETVRDTLGLPIFIKPANAGSSVGVSKVVDSTSFEKALYEAFKYDHKILIEEAIIGKEVECAILGNEKPEPSVIGEIIPTKDFYSYDAKYQDADGAKTKIPANINLETSNTLKEIAVKAFQVTCCEGLARVDFFLREDNSFVLNEINTLPGFTEISMYPKLWEHTGITYKDLISKLIDLSLKRHKRKNNL